MPSPPQTNNAPTSHIDFLDHLRGVAVLMVYLYHALGQSFKIAQFPWVGWFHDFDVPPTLIALFPAMVGWCGVAVFFALSGFCIHLSHERARNKSMRNFFVRRIFRIYPPYLVAMLIFAFVYPWHAIRFQSLGNTANFFMHLTLLHNLDFRSFYGINVAFWSIAVEFQLYLIYPLLLLGVKKFGWGGMLTVLGILEIGQRIAEGIWNVKYDCDLPFLIVGSPFYFWFSWAIGAWLADVYLKGGKLPFRQFPMLFWPCVTLLTIMVRPLLPLAFPAAALATTTFIAVQLTRPRNLYLPSLSHLRFAGVVSYSLYLLHHPILSVTGRGIDKFFPTLASKHELLFAIYLIEWFPIVWISYLFYLWIEKPSIDAGKWLIRKYSPPSVPVPR